MVLHSTSTGYSLRRSAAVSVEYILGEVMNTVIPDFEKICSVSLQTLDDFEANVHMSLHRTLCPNPFSPSLE